MPEFSESSAKRITRVVLDVEKRRRGDSGHRRRYTGSKHVIEIGKLNAELTFGGSAGVSLWRWNGSSFEDSGEDVTAYDWLLSSGQTVASNTQVTLVKIASGAYIVTGAQCA